MENKKIIDYEKISKKFIHMEMLKHEDVEKFVYAMSEIEESSKELYEKILIDLQNENNVEKFSDIFWEMITQYRHILYHLKDGDLVREFNDKDEK